MKGKNIYHSNKSGKDEQYKCISNKSKDTCIRGQENSQFQDIAIRRQMRMDNFRKYKSNED